MKNFFTFKNVIFLNIIIFAICGLFVSFLLTTEKIQLLQIPDIKLPCSINSVLNCASVMKSKQAELFGFPNSILGLIGYSMVLIIGLTSLYNYKFNKILFAFYYLISFLAFIFSYWMLTQSIYVIQILCPFCLVSTISATQIFFSFTLIYMEIGGNKNSTKDGILKQILHRKWYIPFIVLWYVTFLGLIIVQFYDRFK